MATNHPKLASLVGICSQAPNYCLVYERAPENEEPLQDLLTKRPLPWSAKVSIALQVARAAQYSHSVGVPLYDICTKNVLVG